MPIDRELSSIFPTLESELISEIKENGSLKKVALDEYLVHTGQYMNQTLLVLKGLVKIYRDDSEGNEYFMYYLNDGEACALTINCAIRQESSPIIARAVEDTELIVLPVHLVELWFTKYRSWINFVLDNYRDRYMDLMQVLDHIAFRNMDERLEFYLKRHRDNMGTSDVKLTHQEIANELNTSREVISRLLKISLHRYHIQILDL
jgi:CRP/FNR family transcriptional regulator, anaerobic regulatory protein